MKNQTDLSEEPSDVITFICYWNILSDKKWMKLTYQVPIDDLESFELKVLTEVVERRLKEEEKMTDC